jgi:hypothetical protein
MAAERVVLRAKKADIVGEENDRGWRKGERGCTTGALHLRGRAQQTPPKHRTVDRRRYIHAEYSSAVSENASMDRLETGRGGVSGRRKERGRHQLLSRIHLSLDQSVTRLTALAPSVLNLSDKRLVDRGCNTSFWICDEKSHSCMSYMYKQVYSPQHPRQTDRRRFEALTPTSHLCPHVPVDLELDTGNDGPSEQHRRSPEDAQSVERAMLLDENRARDGPAHERP